MDLSRSETHLLQKPINSADQKLVVIRQVNTAFHVFGSVNTFLLDQLKPESRQRNSAFYEGSLIVATVIPSGSTPLRSVMDSYRFMVRHVIWQGNRALKLCRVQI